MGLFDIFDGRKRLNQMLDELIEASNFFLSNMNSKEELIAFLEKNKFSGRLTPSSLHWEIKAGGEPWSFYVNFENDDINNINDLHGSYHTQLGMEEFSKFGKLSFMMSKDSPPFFTIQSPLIGAPIPKKALKLASIIKERGFDIMIYEITDSGFKRIEF